MASTRFKDQCYGSRTLILDMEDILLHWTKREIPALDCHSFHECTQSITWGDLERGSINEKEALYTISQEIGVNRHTLQEVLQHRRKTLRLDVNLCNQLREFKAEMNSELRIYAMTNISEHDFAHLKPVFDNHDLLDGFFASFQAGMRKPPETGYYYYVLSITGSVNKESPTLVDNKAVNVIEARSLGLTGIVFKSPNQLMRQLRNLLLDPTTRARQYMRANARNHVSCIENGPEVRDNFSQFFIHYILHDTSLLNLSVVGSSAIEVEDDVMEAATTAKLWNYFIGPPIGTTTTFPTDTDDTAMALLAFSPPSSSADIILDQFLANRCARRQLIQTCFCSQ
jgi:FMN phosphatase YigB (HAD superfamily)